MRCIIALSGSFRVISAVTKSCPGDLLNGNLCMNDFTPFGVNDLSGSVIGNGLSRKSCILFFIEGMVWSFGLKTSERCFRVLQLFLYRLLPGYRQFFLLEMILF